MVFGEETLILCSKHVTDVEKMRKGLENKFMSKADKTEKQKLQDLLSSCVSD